MRALPAGWKLGALSALYFVQGLPYGFQAKGLPLALASLGLPKATVTLAGVLSLPWLFKPLLAPFVDRHGNPGFGRRKSWIVPLQLALGLTCVVAAFCPPDTRLLALLVAVLFTNVFAAAQDVPVDGLAVDLLGERELGLGNAVQVVGYKVGMIVGGSVLVSQLPWLGWKGLFFSMAALCVAVALGTSLVREPASGPGGVPEQLSWRELAGRARHLVDTPFARLVLLLVATYKVGEALADTLFGLWLMEGAGYSLPEAAGFGGWGMAGSLVGSGVGGLVASRLKLISAVGVAAAGRALPLFAMWALVAGLLPATPGVIIAVTVAEHFFAGLLTTAMFAWMMSRVDKRIGATHFTLLAAVELAGKSVPGLASGALAQRFGFGPVFLLAAVLSALFVLLVPRVARAQARA